MSTIRIIEYSYLKPILSIKEYKTSVNIEGRIEITINVADRYAQGTIQQGIVLKMERSNSVCASIGELKIQ